MVQSQYISYVQTKRITDWKRLVITKGKLTFLYGSNDPNVFAKITTNSILWVIESQPQRPPSLVAKLEIKEIKLLEKEKSKMEKMMEKEMIIVIFI